MQSGNNKPVNSLAFAPVPTDMFNMRVSAMIGGRFKNSAIILIVVLTPILAFFAVLQREIPLVPLQGIDGVCAQCDQKATRTLAGVADTLGSKGVYIWDKQKYGSSPPIWCDRHGPSRILENGAKASLAAVTTLVLGIAVCSRLR